MSQGPDFTQLERSARVLREHFDTVQIFVTRCDEGSGETHALNLGSGNWFARRGQVSAWVVKCVAREGHTCDQDPENY